MVIKLDIGDPKSKRTFHLETSSDIFFGKKIGAKVSGTSIKEVPELGDYEFIITGASNNAGFPCLENVQGATLKRVLLKRGKAMNIKKPKGLRLKRTVRGNTIAEDIAQINLKVSKEGAKPLIKVFGKEEVKEENKEQAKAEEKTEEKTLVEE